MLSAILPVYAAIQILAARINSLNLIIRHLDSSAEQISSKKISASFLD
jgi:hypothetical protein